MRERTVTILCSGMGLGVYVPSLLLEYQLQQRGIKTEVFVIEKYFTKDKRAKLEENRKAYHNNFKVAVMGHKMAKGDITSNLEWRNIEQLLQNWAEGEKRDFIMMSGQWSKILETYLEKSGVTNVRIEAVHLDSGIAPSWKKFKNDKSHFHEVWIFDNNVKDLSCAIWVNDGKVIPFEERENRVFLHGGGWGMGTYRDKINELNHKKIYLDIAAYGEDEISDNKRVGNHYYLMDPAWAPWKEENDKKLEFPPMFEVLETGDRIPLYAKGHPAIFEKFAQCKGIISKPGGGTLLDSLSAATPVVFLEPVAKHEEMNALFWEELGFGISFEKWKDSGYSMELLKQLHLNLMEKRKQTPDYLDLFVRNYERQM